MTSKANLHIAFVISPSNTYSNTYSGVVRQALAWAEGLRQLGYCVDFPVSHQTYNWSSCDIVHLFHFGSWAEGLIGQLRRDGIPLVLSPIVDRSTPYGWRGRLIARLPFERLGLEQRQRVLFRHMQACSTVLARSELEAQSFRDLGIRPERLRIVRLGAEVWPARQTIPCRKARHVFHMSHLDQPRKNVRALINACRKADVPLRLAGKISDPAFASWLEVECAARPGLVYLGPLSEERKWEEMFNAAVFCLPSLNEGVGLVALEAHLAGAHVVITRRSGGTEYLGGEVEICDPTSIEDIAHCLSRALAKPVRTEPRLDALAELSVSASVDKLSEVYVDITSSAGSN